MLTPLAAAQDCRLAAWGSATARGAIDGRTIALTDRRELRLAGIEAAPGGRSALERAVLGRELALFKMGPDRDRYGRLVAVAALPPAEGLVQSLQFALLAQGHAQVSGDLDDLACAAALLGAEKAARQAGLGVWADAAAGPRRAANPAELQKDRGRFALVEGRLLSVRESGNTVYLNFGRHWSTDFTVTISKPNERKFQSSGLDVKNLEGRHVRVRGVIEERGGPWIEAAHLSQIEIAE